MSSEDFKTGLARRTERLGEAYVVAGRDRFDRRVADPRRRPLAEIGIHPIDASKRGLRITDGRQRIERSEQHFFAEPGQPVGQPQQRG